MNLSHEEYLKQFQQSRLLAEQRTNLYGPFNTVPMGTPGGSPNRSNQGVLQITLDATYNSSFSWGFRSSSPTTFTIDWGDGNIEEFDLDGWYYFGHNYSDSEIYEITVTFADPSVIIEFDFND